MTHPMSIGSLPRNDTNYSDDSIGECWYKFPFLSHYILYDTIYYIDSLKQCVIINTFGSLPEIDTVLCDDSIKSVVTIILSDSL